MTLIKKTAVFLAAIMVFLLASAGAVFAAEGQTTIIMSNNIKQTYEIGERVTFTIGVSSDDGSYLTRAWCGFGYNQSTMRLISETDTPDHVWAGDGTPSKWLYRDIEFEMTANGKCYFIAGAYSGDGQIVGYRADGSRKQLPRASLVYYIGTGLYTKTSDCNLKELRVTDPSSGKELSFNRAFDRNVTEYYSGTLPEGISEIAIEAVPEKDSDHVELPADLSLKEGMNDISVRVVAADGDSKDYVLHIERPAVPVSVYGITVKDRAGRKISYDFDPDKLSYELTVPYDTDELFYEASVGDKCEVAYPSVNSLDPGYNIQYVTVSTATDRRKYEFYIMRELSELSLSSLVVEASDETVLDFGRKFDPDVTIYEASVPADVSGCTVYATPGSAHDRIVEEESERELVSGINYVTVTVTDGTKEREYIVKVTREAYDEVDIVPDEKKDKRNLLDFTSYRFVDLLPIALIAAGIFLGAVAIVTVLLGKARKEYKLSDEAASDRNEALRWKRLKKLEKERKKKAKKK